MSKAQGPGESGTDPGDEWVDLIDSENRVTGRTSRREVRGRNLLHRGVGILCFDSGGRVYVHRRTETKDVFPGLYDMFVGGVVESGETYADAARREIDEELGVRGPTPEYLFRHLYEGDQNRSWIQVYRVIWDGPITHQVEEISWGDWLRAEDLESWVDSHTIVPDGLEVYQRYRTWVRSGSPASQPLP